MPQRSIIRRSRSARGRRFGRPPRAPGRAAEPTAAGELGAFYGAGPALSLATPAQAAPPIQARAEAAAPAMASPAVAGVVQSPTGGSPLAADVRARVEPALGADLGHVRVHDDRAAQIAAESIGARAFTHGSRIWLGAGQRPTDLGLMAHEAAHTLQQRPGTIASHRVAPTPVARRSALDLFGDGTPANPGMTLADFERYTSVQADWFAEPSLSATDRDDLWGLLLRTTVGPQILAGVGDLKLSVLRAVPVTDWAPLSAFGRGCHAGSTTLRILSPAPYTLAQRVALGATLDRLEAIIPPAVLQSTVSEQQLVDVQAGGLLPWLSLYWTTFQPHLQQRYTPAAGARGPEFQRILDLLSTPTGFLPFLPLLGRIRNLHRFTVPTLTRLVKNFADTSRRRPVHLVLFSGHDPSGSFAQDIAVFEDLVVNSPNLVLILEGQASLAAITAEIPLIAATYGQRDAGGTYRIGQAMIAGHGESRQVGMAGTGAPTVSPTGEVKYPEDSLNLDTNTVATQNLLDTLMRQLDPATARLVFEGCLVGSNPVPAGTPAAAIPAYLADPAHQSLGRYSETRGVAMGLTPGFVTAARAATGGPDSLRDASGNMTISYSFDPDAFGKASAYAATGRDPIGVLRAAVEVAATAGPVVAETQLRLRLTRPATARGEWWDQCTLALVNVALAGVAPGSGVDITRLNELANLAIIPFTARFNGFGRSVAGFATGVSSKPTVAGDVYAQLASTPLFITPTDADAHAMRLIIEQAWLNFGAARSGPLITYLDTTTPLSLPAETIAQHLDTTRIGGSSSALFPAGAALSSGRIRLALAWLQHDPGNADMRAFLDSQVTMTPAGPTLSAAVLAERGGYTEAEILRALGRLATTATVAGPGGTTVTLPAANAAPGGGVTNRVLVEPQPYTATVLPFALNVRDRPSMAGAVFAWLKRGETVRVMGFTHDWAAIDRNGRLGFVYRTHLTPP